MSARSGRKALPRLALWLCASSAAFVLAGCDAKIVMWPWVEDKPAQTTPAPDAAAAPANGATNVADAGAAPAGDAPAAADASSGAAAPPANPNANPGAPAGDTPFVTAPANPAVKVSDETPPTSVATGAPVNLNALPPLPGVTVTPPPAATADAGAKGPNAAEPAAAKFVPAFFYYRAGDIEPGSGKGATTSNVFSPDMAFPLPKAAAHLQSQVYRYGGGVKGGDQCDSRNFTAPFRDNYCENRSGNGSTTPWCSVTTGIHLGQDIRAGTPEGCRAEMKAKSADRTRYEVVAVEDGAISNVGSYSVSLRAGGRIYRYLHLNMAKLKVALGQSVKKGDVLGYVSNDFGGTPTTLHLHFEIKMNTAETGWAYVPPYTSLVAAYQKREANAGELVTDAGKDAAIASTGAGNVQPASMPK